MCALTVLDFYPNILFLDYRKGFVKTKLTSLAWKPVFLFP